MRSFLHVDSEDCHALVDSTDDTVGFVTLQLILQGNVLGSLNKLDKAESVFLRVLRQDQQNIDALLGLSILQSRQAKYHQVSIVKT